jgi:signal transduction histidine kinase
VTDEAKPLFCEAGCRIATDFDVALPLVDADEHALGRCIQNLLSNACKYGGTERVIGIRVRRCERSREGAVQIEVVDGGPGIPRDELPHIFEPFFQGTRSGQTKASGVGLGLSLTKEMMEAMGGGVTVETGSTGSCFILHLAGSRESSNGKENSDCRGRRRPAERIA